MVVGIVAAVPEHQTAGGVGEVEGPGQIAVEAGLHSGIAVADSADLDPHTVGSAGLGGGQCTAPGGGGIVPGQLHGDGAGRGDGDRYFHTFQEVSQTARVQREIEADGLTALGVVVDGEVTGIAVVISCLQRDLLERGDIHRLPSQKTHRRARSRLELKPLGLELVQQAVEGLQGFLREGRTGEVGLLDPLKFPLDLQDGLQVPQGDGGAVHIAHLAQVGGRVGQQGFHLVQGVLLPVQGEGVVGFQPALFVQQAQLLQHGAGLLGGAAGHGRQLIQKRLVFRRGVVQQVAHGCPGCAGQQGQGHAHQDQQAQQSFLHGSTSFFHASVHLHGIQQLVDGGPDTVGPVVPDHLAALQPGRAEQSGRGQPAEPDGPHPVFHVHNGLAAVAKAELQLVTGQYAKSYRRPLHVLASLSKK